MSSPLGVPAVVRMVLTLPLLASAVLAVLPGEEEPRESPPSGESSARPDRSPRPPRVHDPSTIVRSKGTYWMFSTGNGIQSWRSDELVSWTPGPRVLSETPKWVETLLPGHRGHFWAPDVIELRGRFLLYYSVSTWGKNRSAIALATSPTLDPADPEFRWSDQGAVIRSSERDDFNAIDPGVFLDAAGRLWMTFGSFWSGIQLVELDPATGLRTSKDPPIRLAAHREIEAPCLTAHGDHYYLFVNWGLCCRGTDSTYRIRVGRSTEVEGPYIDREGKDLREGGGSAFLDTKGRYIGPGHAAVLREGPRTWLSYHFYDGSRRGASALAIRELRWTDDGWPEAGSILTPVEER